MIWFTFLFKNYCDCSVDKKGCIGEKMKTAYKNDGRDTS